jgi:MFS family permease
VTEGAGGLRLRAWNDRAIVGLALMALCSGFGQFGAVAALGDVAKSFGHTTHGGTLVQQAGLPGGELGVGLAVLRLASLGGLPLTGLADRVGRRTMLIVTCAVGLAFTVAAAASPGYWWFVVIFALGRPLLSATNALAQVGGAEETDSHNRAKAIALVAAGYGVGSGLTAVIHGLGEGALGFRGVFLMAVVPLAAVFLIRRWLVESDRYTVSAARTGAHPRAVLGAVGPAFRWRLLVVTSLAFAVAVVTGPANSFIFDYAQDVLKLSGTATALMVVVAAPIGLAGLLVGRWLADHVGRRPTGAGAMIAIVGSAILTYSGSRAALLVGYELAVFSASIFAPAAGALANELFPTSVRASVAGWNVAASVLGAVLGLIGFGLLSQVGTRFHGSRGALIVFLPVLATTALFLALPETKGREPEDLWPEGD